MKKSCDYFNHLSALLQYLDLSGIGPILDEKLTILQIEANSFKNLTI